MQKKLFIKDTQLSIRFIHLYSCFVSVTPTEFLVSFGVQSASSGVESANVSNLSTYTFLPISERTNDSFDAFFTEKLTKESNNTEGLDLKERCVIYVNSVKSFQWPDISTYNILIV